MPQITRSLMVSVCVAAVTLAGLQPGTAQTQPAGELVYAMHVTLSPSWFDPAELPAQITPFGVLYALHDAVVRPLPGERSGPALAASWRESPDGLTYEFTLRPGLTFHNGDPCTAEDVVYSFTRYKGVGAGEFKTRVKSVEAVEALTVRFHLHAPWPDFMTMYGTTATGAAMVVPKKYLEQVGDDGTLFEQQALERDSRKRAALLQRIQELTMERVMFAPIMDFRALIGIGPRVAEHAIHALPVHPFPPLEEIRLK